VQPIRSHREGTPARGAEPAGFEAVEPEAPVYPPREDTRLLLPYSEVPPGTLFLEVGAGAGVAALAAAQRGARVVATDLNPHALRRLRARARALEVEIDLVRTDLAHGLGRFDRILANPPYLPTQPEQRDPDPWHNLALDGGPDGCRVTARLVDELDRHLAEAGSAFVVVSSVQNPDGLRKIRESWVTRGGTVVEVAARVLEGERLVVWRLALGPDYVLRSA
jgi:release factor glutamine methyltransferase